MVVRDIYLRIEEILGYSPVEPSPHGNYRRDCMRNTGHEDGTIPLSEVNARSLNALVYREYLDPDYLLPKPDKLVLTDVNEPMYTHRVPGTVIYAHPGQRLHIHVFNADSLPHSFHVHALRFGIDSDGSWPFGTQAADGRRSDEICPGQSWTYRYDVDASMVGAWPFHDHSRHIGESVNRGLFGGIVVLPDDCEQPPRFQLPRLVAGFRKLRTRIAPGDDPRRAAHLEQSGGVTGGGHGHAGAAEPPAGAGRLGHPGGLEPVPGGGHGGGGHGGEGGGHAGGGHGRAIGRRVLDHEHKGVLAFLEEYSQLQYAHPKPGKTLHVPMFLHLMSRGRGTPAFNSGPISPAGPPFEATFGGVGTFSYHCELHQQMQGQVVVAAGEALEVTVAIVDANPMDMRFDPPEARVRPGGTVRWTPGTTVHTATEDGAGIPSFCFNGRSFIGNSPTVVAQAGQRIRWYVFNLDFGMMWHNFHPHSQRWTFANEALDVRSIGPAESFVVDTVAPPVLLLPPDIEKAQDPKCRSKKARPYEVCGDFLFHCHVEMHMMQGLAGLVRSKQRLWLTAEQAEYLKKTVGLPTQTCRNACPKVDLEHCEKTLCGEWELVPGSPEVCMMHAALIPDTAKVMYFGYGDTRDDQARIWNADTGTVVPTTNQPFDVTQPPHNRGLANIWSAEHAYLADPQGSLVVHGGFTPRQTFVFDPVTSGWTRKAATASDRFYSTTLTMSDGRLLTLFGSASKSLERYDPAAGTWSGPINVPMPAMGHHEYYPWAYLLPGGKIFIAGPHMPTQRFNWSPAGISNLESFPSINGNRSSGGEKGTSVLLALRPPDYVPRALIAGGDFGPAQQTAEWIDLSAPAPAWVALANLNVPRPQQVNSVLLPDGRVMVAGGIDAANGGPTEIFDPRDPAAGWELCATMSIPRGYHSAAILLPDGSVLMGGDRPGAWKSGETLQNERFYPSYFSLARPVVTASPATLSYGAAFSIGTPSPASIAEVLLLRPGAVTHGFNMSQRLVECEITGVGGADVQAVAPPNGQVAPPGPYLLYLLSAGRAPSLGRWVHLS